MARVTDIAQIRAALHADPAWAAYARCDLDPALFPLTMWFEPSLTLVLHAYGTCILFAMGTESVPEAMSHATWPFHVQVQEDAFAVVSQMAHIEHDRRMWRMRLARRHQASHPSVTRLGWEDVPALQDLYADGYPTGEAPDFFMPTTVPDGAYFGIYEAGALVAAAGTHVLSRQEGAAAIGNVYTRRDRRGRGLGRAVTRAVADALSDVETVVLNVRADNTPAQRLYESLGFERHCLFHEAVAASAKIENPRSPAVSTRVQSR